MLGAGTNNLDELFTSLGSLERVNYALSISFFLNKRYAGKGITFTSIFTVVFSERL